MNDEAPKAHVAIRLTAIGVKCRTYLIRVDAQGVAWIVPENGPRLLEDRQVDNLRVETVE